MLVWMLASLPVALGLFLLGVAVGRVMALVRHARELIHGEEQLRRSRGENPREVMTARDRLLLAAATRDLGAFSARRYP